MGYPYVECPDVECPDGVALCGVDSPMWSVLMG